MLLLLPKHALLTVAVLLDVPSRCSLGRCCKWLFFCVSDESCWRIPPLPATSCLTVALASALAVPLRLPAPLLRQCIQFHASSRFEASFSFARLRPVYELIERPVRPTPRIGLTSSFAALDLGGAREWLCLLAGQSDAASRTARLTPVCGGSDGLPERVGEAASRARCFVLCARPEANAVRLCLRPAAVVSTVMAHAGADTRVASSSVQITPAALAAALWGAPPGTSGLGPPALRRNAERAEAALRAARDARAFVAAAAERPSTACDVNGDVPAVHDDWTAADVEVAVLLDALHFHLSAPSSATMPSVATLAAAVALAGSLAACVDAAVEQDRWRREEACACIVAGRARLVAAAVSALDAAFAVPRSIG